MDLDPIYSEMAARNGAFYATGDVAWDPLLKTPEDDARRCIALVASGPIRFQNADFMSRRLPSTTADAPYAIPVFHHTFLVAAPWRHEPGAYATWQPPADLVRILETIPAYSVSFDRIIPVKTGITLCGTPTAPINEHRQRLRDAGFCGEGYTLDIAHASLCRWTAPLSATACRDILDLFEPLSCPQPEPFAHMDVTHVDIVEASWLMHPKDIRHIERVEFKNMSTN